MFAAEFGAVLAIIALVTIAVGKIEEDGTYSADIEAFLKRVRDTYSDLRRKP